ncbi:MAG: BlaI/MecI/CopY family transcriptional regulator [Candidatus Micrarchaeota archaeon]
MVSIRKLSFDKAGKKASGAAAVLSGIEAEIMDVVWDNSPVHCCDVRSVLKRKVAPTTVAVMLDRLYDRGLVMRKAETARGGVRYLYSPKVTRDGFCRTVVEQTVDNLITAFGPSAVNFFNEKFRSTSIVQPKREK